MQDELVRGYRNFMLGAIKTYFLGRNIIQDEVDFFTGKRLKDSLIFFLCIFEQIEPKLLKNLTFEDEEAFKEYVDLSKKGIPILTPKGEELKQYLESKLAVHAAMLEFNGIKPQYIGKITTIMKRFEKFWQMILTFSRKSSTAEFKIDWMEQQVMPIMLENSENKQEAKSEKQKK